MATLTGILLMILMRTMSGTSVGTVQTSLNIMKCRIHDDSLKESCCSLTPDLKVLKADGLVECARHCSSLNGSIQFNTSSFFSNFNLTLSVNHTHMIWIQNFKFQLNFLPSLLPLSKGLGICYGFNFRKSTGMCELFGSFCYGGVNTMNFGNYDCKYYEIVPYPRTMCYSKVLKDCTDLSYTDPKDSGLYWINVGGYKYPVYCEIKNGKIYTVVQRRIDGSVDFYRNWTEYAQGFGDIKGEYWIGNQMLYLLTSKYTYNLRVDLEAYDGVQVYAEYTTFSVASPATMYTLTVAGYSGNASPDSATDSLLFHNGMKFTTLDVDNDQMPYNCAERYTGAWWYKTCHASNLNGLYLPLNSTLYGQGICWKVFRGFVESMKFCRMMIVRV